MCGVARGKHDFIQMAIISLQSGFNLQIFISKWNPQQSSTNLGIYEDFKRLTMSSHSFAKFVKHAIIMQEKSGLWMPKKSTKGLLTNPGNLNYAMLSQCKNVIEHYSWALTANLSMTHHKQIGRAHV